MYKAKHIKQPSNSEDISFNALVWTSEHYMWFHVSEECRRYGHERLRHAFIFHICIFRLITSSTNVWTMDSWYTLKHLEHFKSF